MGQSVNSIAFRLGSLITWKSSWIVIKKPLYRRFLQEDFLIFRFLKLFLNKYTVPLFSITSKRNNLLLEDPETTGEEKLIHNPFLERQLLFSHIFLGRANILTLDLFLFDSLLEEWRFAITRITSEVSSQIFHPNPFKKNRPKYLRLSRSIKKSTLFYPNQFLSENYLDKTVLKKRNRRRYKKKVKLKRTDPFKSGKEQVLSGIKQHTFRRKPHKTRKVRSKFRKRRFILRKKRKNKHYFGYQQISKFKQDAHDESQHWIPKQLNIIGEQYKKIFRKKKSIVKFKKIKVYNKKKNIDLLFEIINKLKNFSSENSKKNYILKKINKKILYKKKLIKEISRKKLNLKTQIEFLHITNYNDLFTINKQNKALKIKYILYVDKYKKTSKKKIIIERLKKLFNLNYQYVTFWTKLVKNVRMNLLVLTNYLNYLNSLNILNKTQIKNIKINLNKWFSIKKEKTIQTESIKEIKKEIIKLIQINEEHQKAVREENEIKQIRLKLYPLFIFDLLSKTKNIFVIPPTKNIFNILKVMLILFRIILQTSEKFVCFFIITFRKLLLSIHSLPLFKINFNFIKILNICYIKEISFRHLNNIYFKKIFKERFLMFQIASLAINYSLKSFNKNENYLIRFKGLHTKHISANLISNFISMKLSQYYTINEILRPLLWHLKTTRTIRGFKLLIAGRLTRKERAAYIIRRSGFLPLVTQACTIDFSSEFKIMRFGLVGVKVWLYTKDTHPYYYSFNFVYKSINKNK